MTEADQAIVIEQQKQILNEIAAMRREQALLGEQIRKLVTASTVETMRVLGAIGGRL